MTTLTIDFRNFKRGRGFWKFNNSLLKDPNYVSLVKNVIKRVIKQYAVNSDDVCLEDANPEDLQEVRCSLNPQLLYDMIQLEIRGETIKYSSWCKKERERS